MIQRVNKACKYFLCHKHLEDCTFCYCPFYPCSDDGLGQRIYSQKLKKYVWSCVNCSWIHRKKTVERIFSLIRKNAQGLRQDTPLALIAREKLKDRHIGVILLGHGSRLKKANALIPGIIKDIKRRLGINKIYPAYLQLAAPDLSLSIRNLAGKKCEKIIIVPFFLFVGNHVSRDIPEIISKEKAKYPHISFAYTKNLGEDIRIGEIVADKIMEGIDGGN